MYDSQCPTLEEKLAQQEDEVEMKRNVRIGQLRTQLQAKLKGPEPF